MDDVLEQDEEEDGHGKDDDLDVREIDPAPFPGNKLEGTRKREVVGAEYKFQAAKVFQEKGYSYGGD
jgi:hypothetical protein